MGLCIARAPHRCPAIIQGPFCRFHLLHKKHTSYMPGRVPKIFVDIVACVKTRQGQTGAIRNSRYQSVIRHLSTIVTPYKITKSMVSPSVPRVANQRGADAAVSRHNKPAKKKPYAGDWIQVLPTFVTRRAPERPTCTVPSSRAVHTPHIKSCTNIRSASSTLHPASSTHIPYVQLEKSNKHRAAFISQGKTLAPIIKG